MSNDRPYLTIDIERRGYGRRYTWLPVDTLTHEGFQIDFTGAFMRPELIDIQPGDIVRWREGERHIEGLVVNVLREGMLLSAQIANARPLPPGVFYP